MSSQRIWLTSAYVVVLGSAVLTAMLRGPVNAFANSHVLSATLFLGFWTIFSLIREVQPDEPVFDHWDIFAIVSGVLFLAIPLHETFALGTTLLGIVLTFKPDRRLASIGQLSLAIAWMDFWGPELYSLLEQWILPVESALAFVPLVLSGHFTLDGTIIDNGHGHAIQIQEACSAFRNTVATSFIWLCLLKLQRLPITRRYLITLFIALLCIVVLNSARIAILATSMQNFEYWHNGFGVQIVKAAKLAAICIVFYLGFSDPRKPLLVPTFRSS
jgi:exosortase/archaeosortase family protein